MSRIAKRFIRFGTGTDEVNSRSIPANYTPSNYTPDEVSSEGDDKISAHLKGIDAALTGSGATYYTNTIANNQSSPQDITDALFNPASFRAVELEFSIQRTTSTAELTSVGTIYLSYFPTSTTWGISYDSTFSNAGITFDITDAGQLTYTSTNISGTGYAGDIKYTYKTFAT